jgi:hypothetical protein
MNQATPPLLCVVAILGVFSSLEGFTATMFVIAATIAIMSLVHVLKKVVGGEQ